MNAITSLQQGCELARASIEQDQPVEINEGTERVAVYWFVPEGDLCQHATLDELGPDGGEVATLGGHGRAHAPPHDDRRMGHVRPFCDSCFTAYVNLPLGQPNWKA